VERARLDLERISAWIEDEGRSAELESYRRAYQAEIDDWILRLEASRWTKPFGGSTLRGKILVAESQVASWRNLHFLLFRTKSKSKEQFLISQCAWSRWVHGGLWPKVVGYSMRNHLRSDQRLLKVSSQLLFFDSCPSKKEGARPINEFRLIFVVWAILFARLYLRFLPPDWPLGSQSFYLKKKGRERLGLEILLW